MSDTSRDELLERARKVIHDLREKLSVTEARNRSEPIAVIGMGLRFPGCGDDPKRFWQMVSEGQSSVTAIPSDRWNREEYYASEAPVPAKMNTQYGSFLDDVRRFDAQFFDITPTEAERMDPQQRIFMETAWHAIEDAGLSISRLTGSDTGVFVGVHTQSIDYLSMQLSDLASLNAYSGTGTAHDVIAGRLSYWLDLHGPAMAVNTACSSSLVAVHLACRSLRTSDCTVALAGGVNLLLTPQSTVAAAQLQLLSPDGRCKTFDARADGMGRGEGCGVVVLKKLSDAQRDGDRVLAVLRGSAVNQDGKTNGLTAPNGLAQQRVLRKALEDSGLGAEAIGYLETHGTGTALGDPIEVEALTEVLGRAPKRTSPLTLGAVKANIGHLEGAAGVAGLIKSVMVLRHRWTPPVANLGEINPHLVLESSGIEIPKKGREWKSTQPRIAGVSSFGWSGTNAHVILEEAFDISPPSLEFVELPILISAQSPEALHALAAKFAMELQSASASKLHCISYTSAVRRTHHSHRIAVAGNDGAVMATTLRRYLAEGRKAGEHRATELELSERLKLWEAGTNFDWDKFVPPAPIIDLPLYPFQGKSYWLEDADSSVPVSMLAEGSDQQHAEWFYKTEWIEKVLDGTRIDPGTIILLHLTNRDIWKIAQILRERQHRVIEVRSGKIFQRLSDDMFEVGDDVTEGIAEVLSGLSADGLGDARVLYFPDGASAESLIEEAFVVSKAFVQSGKALHIWFVTENADGPRRGGGENSQAALRGFGRVFGIEYPDLFGGVIDIDMGNVASIAALCDELEISSDEDRLAIRDGRRWVPRLRCKCPSIPTRGMVLSPGRSYLVTGAFGELGVEIASWLVSRGARHLVLLGRRSLEETGNAVLKQQIDAWRAQGITVSVETCDVSQERQVQQLLNKIGTTGFLLAGVVHAAANLRMDPLAQLNVADVRATLHAKVTGAQVLDRSTRSLGLDFFVLFSSASATIGMRNGALYAAASSYLNEIVRVRREQGLTGLCIEWGSWKSVRDNSQRVLIDRSGFLKMSPPKAMRAMEHLLLDNCSEGLVAAIEWSVLGPALEMRGCERLIEEFLPDRTVVLKELEEPKIATSLAELSTLSKQDREDRLCDVVSVEVRKIFGMEENEFLDISRGLFQMGMDSLMSVKLKRALEIRTGLRLPGTLTLLYPNISKLGAYLEEKLVPKPDKDKAASGSQYESLKDVSEMTDQETSAAIAAELTAIHQKLGAM